jgi:V/A-type H+-transporting ATPase subunit D
MDTSTLPTKNNLMKIKEKLKLSSQGQELLEKKKIILEMEKEKHKKNLQEKRENLEKLFNEGINKIKIASIDIGLEELKDISEEVDFKQKIDIKYKTVMGVEIPSIIYEKQKQKTMIGLYNTNIQVDEAIEIFTKIKTEIIELAEIENTILRINKAIEKVKKRSNALKDIIIPEEKQQIKTIEGILEEREREEFSRLKVIKKKI